MLPPDFCHEPGHRRIPLGIDVGDVVSGHRFVVRGLCLFDGQITIHYAWVPGLTVDYSDGDIFPNFHYSADVPPADWTSTGSYAPCEGGLYTEGGEQYTGPGAGAREVYLSSSGRSTNTTARACRARTTSATGSAG